MKETIEYYYLVQVDNLNVDNNTYNFFYNGFWYFFVHYNRTEKEFEDIKGDLLTEMKSEEFNAYAEELASQLSVTEDTAAVKFYAVSKIK